MSKSPRRPAGLGPDGARLWTDLHERFDFGDAEHLCYELAVATDRLAQIRKTIAATTDPGELVRLIGGETKICATFARLWRLAGLAAPDEPPKKGR